MDHQEISEETAADKYIRTRELELELGQEVTTLFEYVLIEPGSSTQTARSKYL